jgi:uncharacterized protein with HEPN domain
MIAAVIFLGIPYEMYEGYPNIKVAISRRLNLIGEAAF